MAPELLVVEDDFQTIPTTQMDVYSFGSIMLQVCDPCVHSRSDLAYGLPERRIDSDRQHSLSLPLPRRTGRCSHRARQAAQAT